MDELMGRAPVAHEHLAQIGPPLQEDLSAQILALNHESLGRETFDFGPDFSNPIPEDQRTPEQHEHHQRVTGLMELAAGLTKEAHQVVAEHRKVKGEGGEISSEEILHTAKALALDTAEAAKQRGDKEAVAVSMRGFLTLGLLGEVNSSHESKGGDADVREAIRRGLADELVSGVQELAGVVAVRGHGRDAIETRMRFNGRASLIEVATGRSIVDGESISEERARESESNLSSQDLMALAGASSDKVKARELAIQAVERLRAIGMETTGAEVAAILREARDACADGSKEVAAELNERISRLRSERQAGNHYRINNHVTYKLDEALADLVGTGELDLAYGLLSASNKEISSSSDENQDEYNNGIFDRDYVYGDGKSPEEITAVRESIRKLHEQKQSELRQSLVASGAGGPLIDTIMERTFDPDSAMPVTAEFWQSCSELDPFVLEHVIGGYSPDIFEASQVAMIMQKSELDGYGANTEIFRHTLECPPERREAYVASVKKLAGEMHTYVTADTAERGYRLLDESSLVFRYLDFQDPMAAWQFGEQLLGPDSVHKSWHVLELMRDSHGQRDVRLDPDRVGLLLHIKQELTDYPSIWDEASWIKSAILNNPSPKEAAERFIGIFDGTEFGALIDKGGIAEDYADLLVRYVMQGSEAQANVEQIASAFTQTGFGALVSVDGAGYGLGRSLVESVIQAKEPRAMAEQLVRVFEGGGSLWHTTSELAGLIVHEGFYDTGAKIRRIPSSMPTRDTRHYNPEAISYTSGEDMADMLRLYGVGDVVIQNAAANNWEVEISALPENLKQTLLTAYLYEAITRSRDPELRDQASKRNAEFTAEDMWGSGSLHHVTHATTILSILQNGALPGELVLDHARADSYPFNLDMCEATSQVVSKSTHGERIDALASSGFGGTTIHFRREPGGYREGEEFVVSGYGGQHRLVPGGLPSTEISGITIGAPEQLPLLTHAVLEAGLYVPIFGKSGEVLLSYEQYQQLRENGNYNEVQPEIVDTKFQRPNSQAGSNEGAEFIVPADVAGGKPERYYVKFAQPENEDHLWTELLSDTIYRTVSPTLVPDTRPVILEGRLARASRMVEPDGTPVTESARNAGFLIDCLLGNWDATYNPDNLVMSGGQALRIDTGNTLFFRARGGRKPEGAFSEVVREVQVGTDGSDLGTGMRQNYPGITREQIQAQAQELQARLPDDAIDQLVDGVRMNAAERSELKRVLKARRDYVVNWALSQTEL